MSYYCHMLMQPIADDQFLSVVPISYLFTMYSNAPNFLIDVTVYWFRFLETTYILIITQPDVWCYLTAWRYCVKSMFINEGTIYRLTYLLTPPSGEIGMTSLPVIEKSPISPEPLQISVSFCTWFLTVSMLSIGLLQYHNKVIKQKLFR